MVVRRPRPKPHRPEVRLRVGGAGRDADAAGPWSVVARLVRRRGVVRGAPDALVGLAVAPLHGPPQPVPIQGPTRRPPSGAVSAGVPRSGVCLPGEAPPLERSINMAKAQKVRAIREKICVPDGVTSSSRSYPNLCEDSRVP